MNEDRNDKSPETPAKEKGAEGRMPRPRVIIGYSLFALAAILFLILQKRSAPFFFNMVASIFGAAWVILRWFIRPIKTAERILLALSLAVLFVGVIFHDHYESAMRMYKQTRIRTWNMYHYYMGSKYFNEVGYQDLYLQTILADREEKKKLEKIKRVRDMTDYKSKLLEDILPENRNPRFTDDRWDRFKRDLNIFLRMESAVVWDKILRDRGYNPTPFWNTVGNTISNWIDIGEKKQLLLATSIDLMLYLLAFIAITWAFGIEPAMLVLLSFILLPFSTGRLVGGYIQYDWYACIAVGLCMYKKRHPIGSAFSFGYAVMARVFPLILVAGLGMPVLRKLIRTRKIERPYIYFGAAFAFFCLAGLWVGSQSNKGFQAWTEWKSKLSLHNYEMTFGEGRVGLKHIFVHKLGEPRRFETEDQRKKVYRQQRYYYYVAAAFFVLLFFTAFWLRKDVNAMLLAMVVMFILLVPSHYYWSILSFLPLWVVREGEPWNPALIPSLMSFLVPAEWYRYAQTINNPLAPYIRFDWMVAVCFFVLMTALIVQTILVWKGAVKEQDIA